jgi:hypothetical protein
VAKLIPYGRIGEPTAHDGGAFGAARLRLQHLVKVRLGCQPNRLKELSLVPSQLVAILGASEARNDGRHPLLIRSNLLGFEATIGCPMHAARFWRELID